MVSTNQGGNGKNLIVTLDKYKRLDATLGNKRIGKLNMLWKSPNLRPIDMKEY